MDQHGSAVVLEVSVIFAEHPSVTDCDVGTNRRVSIPVNSTVTHKSITSTLFKMRLAPNLLLLLFASCDASKPAIIHKHHPHT